MVLSNKSEIFVFYKMYSNRDYNFCSAFNGQVFLNNPKNYNDKFDSFILIDREKFRNSYIKNHKLAFEDMHSKKVIQQQLQNFRSETNCQDDSPITKNKQNEEIISIAYDSYCKKISELINEYYIACFTLNKPEKNMVMWSHYADNYKGFCAEYSFEKLQYDINTSRINEYQKFLYNKIVKVKYVNEKAVEIDYDILSKLNVESLGENSYIRSCIKRALREKEKQWKYENEYRLILHKDDINQLKAIKENCVLLLDNGCMIDFNYLNRLYLVSDSFSCTNKPSLDDIAKKFRVKKSYLYVTNEKRFFMYDNLMTVTANMELLLSNIPPSNSAGELPF